MTISYNWLNDYLPEQIEPHELSGILTSVGLEVESLEKFESIRGGLEGLVIGEVLTCEKHPNADKLKVTSVNIGNGKPLQIVCGAANVGVGQKVVVAPAGSTIHPLNHEPVTMKVAKIRGVESEGMICAEDEIGLSDDHSGIMVLPPAADAGTPASTYFKIYTDWIYEIGLTPNRMDAMSHLGVARDLCAYLSYHRRKMYRPRLPFGKKMSADNHDLPIEVTVEDTEACARYSGVSITGITVKESPEWLQDKLRAIGQKPINNIVDITNFILHETGQPLHAFDADAIDGRQVIVKELPAGYVFVTLDGKERKLNGTELMICDRKGGMCIAGIYGGIHSGVKASTTNIFLESAWFNPVNIRRTSVAHDLRTDAAMRFEKGVDISNTVHVLQRAALLMKEVCGGHISSDIVDVYPQKREKPEVALSFHYLNKLSGKEYSPGTVKDILHDLGFEILSQDNEGIQVAVPFNKPDIALPADLVEEIIRIDGLDNIAIPATITLTPSVERLAGKERLREKLADYLVGLGFQEILTNSITNSRYYPERAGVVRMINNLSAELDVLRPSMLETALESIAYNLNRKNGNIRFFEFGKTYATAAPGVYQETEHLSLFLSGTGYKDAWRDKSKTADFYMAKGFVASLFKIAGVDDFRLGEPKIENDGQYYPVKAGGKEVGRIANVSASHLRIFDIQQPVYFIDLYFEVLLELYAKQTIVFKELSKFPAVQRDLAIIVDRSVPYRKVEEAIDSLKLSQLHEMRLFDVFESDKLGTNKKSFAINFNFINPEKTLTDTEIDGMMSAIVQKLETELQAGIRK